MSSSFPSPPEARRKSSPFWKRWWFWAAVVVVILVAANAGSSETEQTGAQGASPTASAPASTAPATTAPPAPETARVPNVAGKSIDAARSKLEAAGFSVSVETKLTNTAPAGRVLRQSERAGSRFEVGNTITLTVAKPLPTIPNVVGKSLANAKKTLQKAGFEVGKVTQQTSSQPKGTVISQSPAAGTSARPGRTVDLVIAKLAAQPNNCTPGYSPCLIWHNGADYDCAGGSGDGPYYTGRVTVTGPDPYDLDADGDGVGCE